MNLSSGKPSMSTASWKSTDSVPDQFPAGMRVLVVDDDPTCLKIVEKMLKTCLYEVTTCNRAEKALAALQANRNGFDMVISDVHMPDMNGFKLLELIGLEMDLPVIMMSADDGKSVVMKGVTHGACDYLIKPIRIEELKNIWQHVVRKRKHEWKEMEQSASVDDGDRQQNNNKHNSEDADYSSSATEGNWKNSKRRKEEEDDLEERDDSSALKKPRVVWSVELHQQFVGAVNQLGIDKAVPKKILELMNVPGLTRENVASHLQKYRLYLRRLSGVSQHQGGGMNGSFISTQDATYGPMTSLNGLDHLQALAVSGQLPAQSLATLQAAGFGRPSPKSTISIPLIDHQRNIFSFDNSKQQPSIISNNPPSKQLNLLHGIPTTMEPKQLASLHQSAHQSFETSAALLMQQQQQMGQSQPQSRAPIVILGDNSNSPSSSSRISRLPINQPNVGNGILSRAQTSLSFPMTHHHGGTDLQGNNNSSFGPLGGLPNLTPSKFQEEVSSDIKGSAPLMPTSGYYMLNELQQMRSNNNWQMQQQNNVGLGFGASTTSNNNTIMQGGNLENPSNLLLQQQGGLSSSASSTGHHQRSLGHIRNNNNTSSGGGSKVMYCSSTEGGAQSLNSVVTGGVRIKSENVVDSTVVVGPAPAPLFQDHFDQEDLMSALLKQQEGIVPVNNEFDFDGYSIDNIPV